MTNLIRNWGRGPGTEAWHLWEGRCCKTHSEFLQRHSLAYRQQIGGTLIVSFYHSYENSQPVPDWYIPYITP